MSITKVSSKFQIVLPKSIRKKINIKVGQKFNCTVNNGKIELIPILTPNELLGYLNLNKEHSIQRQTNRLTD